MPAKTNNKTNYVGVRLPDEIAKWIQKRTEAQLPQKVGASTEIISILVQAYHRDTSK